MSKSWYAMRSFSARAGKPATAEIDLYGEIGMWGVSPADFVRDLRALGDVKELTVNINSPGGEVFAGLALYNVLKRHPAKVTARIDGIAASMASVVAMAGDTVEMPENAMMMVHSPSGLVMGTAEDMRELADALDKTKGSLIAAYRDKTGLEDAKLDELLTGDTWMTAAEAKELGFCDVITEPVRIAASANKLARYCGDLPPSLKAQVSPEPVPTSEEASVPTENQPAGTTPAAPPVTDPNTPAAEPNDGGTPPAANPPVQPPADPEKAAEAKFQARAVEINELCALAGLAHKAGELIASGKPVAEVRKSLVEMRAHGDAARVTNGAHGQVGELTAKVPDPVEIYASRARAMNQR